eukprot:GHVP01047691.1.p1 GENE.GHVP01047691.1~~GHVP01047691.1.p1  ORF type:complete len:164 (+),score=30.62 GHVP01047691.1:129-620(+)
MSSYSRQLLLRQFQELQKGCGFSVGMVDDNVFSWKVCLYGPPGTPYEGGVFNTFLDFPEDFPNSPPVMRFDRDIWHPNVYPDGTVCISILHPAGLDAFNEFETAEERWRPVLGVESVLISVVSLLGDPNIESPAHIDAANHMKLDPIGWKQKCRKIAEKTLEG